MAGAFAVGKRDAVRSNIPAGIAVGLALVVAHGVLAAQPEDASRLVVFWRVAVQMFGEAIAIGALVQAGRRHPEARVPTLLLAGAFAFWFAGDLVYNVIDQIGGGDVPYPGVPDAFYVLYFPVAFAALVALIRLGSNAEGALPIVDSFAVVIAAFALLWFLVGGPIAADSAASVLARVTGLTLVVGDLAVFTLIVWVLRYSVVGRLAAVRLLAAALAGFLVVDTLYSWSSFNGDYVNGGVIDTLYVANYGLLLLAGLCTSWAGLRFDEPPAPIRLRERVSPPTIALLLLPLALAAVSVATGDLVTTAGLIGAVACAAAAGVAHVSLTAGANERVLAAEAELISERTRSEIELDIHDNAMQEIAAARLAVEQAKLSGSTDGLDVAAAALEAAARRIRRRFDPPAGDNAAPGP